MGTVVTPKNFPKHKAEDLTDMFRLNAELGNVAVVRVNWNDANRFVVAKILVRMADQQSLSSVVELSPFKADGLKGASLDPGKALSGVRGDVSFSNPAVAEAYSKAVLELAEIRPAYLAVATDVNLFAMTDRAGFRAFVDMYRDLYPRIKRTSPDTRVFVTFQWDAMRGESAGANRDLVEAFRSSLDVLAFTSEPRKLFEREGPDGVPADYYSRISQYRSDNRPLLLEVSWPSDGRNGDADQVTYIRSLPRLLDRVDPSILVWSFLHDVKILIFTVRAGLINSDGREKPAFAALKDISGNRSASREPARGQPRTSPSPSPSTTSRASREPAHFGIYTARLDGSDVQTIMTSPDREMTHPRLSPDGKRIVLTRYNNRGKDGKASEEQGYDNTEIMIVNLDGTGLETIIAPKPGVIAANGAWTPDGKSLIFISTDTPKRQPEIRQIDLATRRITRVPTPSGLQTTDPHWEGDEVVFPVKGEGADTLWIMKADGSDARQITRPTQQRKRGSLELYGDFDPKLSPDGSKVAFMRIAGGEAWRVMVLDRKTGQERNLTTEDGIVEGLPTWSSDGRLLLYRHIDRKKPKEVGLYIMTPEGDDRKMVPLPRGFLYNHGTFFPGDGSGGKARIIYTGTVAPGL
jgi:Tol biopolymer transport system component